MNAAAIDTIARELRPQTALAAGAAVILLTAVAGVLYGIKPAWLEYRDLAQQHERAQQQFSGEAGANSQEAITAAESTLEALRDRLYGGAAVVPRRQIEAFVVDTLDRLSVAHDVQLRGVTPELPGAVLMFEELPYEVQVSGPYYQLHRWLHQVEEALRPMVMKQFAMSPTRGTDEVTMQLRLVAYRTLAQEAGS